MGTFDGIKFVFYRDETRISLSAHKGLTELQSETSLDAKIEKFNEYFDSVMRKDPANPDLSHYDTFNQILSTLKFID